VPEQTYVDPILALRINTLSRAGRIDVVVVYEVDRLTRALSDFAKMVEIFDGAGVSFVSVTQAFKPQHRWVG
jgi:DNA invertase Pin-like site-specific DNA recombinase